MKSKIPVLSTGRVLSWLCAAFSSTWEHVAVCQIGFWTGCEAIKYMLYNQNHLFWLL